MKKYVIGMSILIVILCLTSCVGIGDGALFDNIQTSGESNVSADDDTTSVKPTSVTLRAINSLSSSIPAEIELGADEAAEIYELIMSAEILELGQSPASTFPRNYILVSFSADSGSAQFQVEQNGEITQSHGFLEGNAFFFDRYSEGIYDKIMEYLK
ncbi:MAG: hypothetical protein J6S71_00845 [Clostridia bacterium]|nr:hypothetical protein [Clostridia bacterium]